MPMPGTMEGSAIRLGMPILGAEVPLGIAEGIETAVCAGKLFGVPVWAAISANGLQTWEPPEGISKVFIFGDNDASFTGQASAYVLAKRLTTNGISVEVQIPPKAGKDWADVYAERHEGGAA